MRLLGREGARDLGGGTGEARERVAERLVDRGGLRLEDRGLAAAFGAVLGAGGGDGDGAAGVAGVGSLLLLEPPVTGTTLMRGFVIFFLTAVGGGTGLSSSFGGIFLSDGFGLSPFFVFPILTC